MRRPQHYNIIFPKSLKRYHVFILLTIFRNRFHVLRLGTINMCERTDLYFEEKS